MQWVAFSVFEVDFSILGRYFKQSGKIPANMRFLIFKSVLDIIVYIKYCKGRVGEGACHTIRRGN